MRFFILSILCFTATFSNAQNFTLTGMVQDSFQAPIKYSKVFLLKKIPGRMRLDTALVADTDINGYYIFSGLDSGRYIVRTMPNRDSFPTRCPTYYGDAVYWNKAQFLQLSSDTANINIVVQGWPGATNGFGRIKGKVIKGNLQKHMGPGEPIKGVNVSLINKDTDARIKLNISDLTGTFTFLKVPDGDYFFYADIPGIPVDTSNMNSVSVVSSDTVFEDVNITVDSTLVSIAVPTGVTENLRDNITFGVYPNPAEGNTVLYFNLKYKATMNLTLCNILGETVNITNEFYDKGRHEILLLTEDLPAGIYFLSLKVDSKVYSRKFIKN